VTTSSGRVTLAEVAAAAGVSKSIASRVLNEYESLSVRAETRDRVLEAASRLRYRPHAAARGLRKAQTGVLGLLIPSLMNTAYARIVRGAVHRALEREAVAILQEDLDAREAEMAVSRLVQAGRIDGLIVASARPRHPLLAQLRGGSMPHVFVNRAVRGSGRNVTMDDAAASAMAVEHLRELGHTRVGHVSGPATLDPARRRAEGFRRHAARLRLAEVALAEGEFSEAGGALAARLLLEEYPRLTALYTSSLTQAVGALHAAWELGRRVPDDLSVLTSDETPLANFLRPPLTTIRMPLAVLGAAAVDALLEQLAGEPPRDVVVDQPPELVRRGSTARPPVA
jgi:DNA-binding LacI/PurR family transcriptional regulator